MDFNALKEKYIPSADIFLYNTGRARKACCAAETIRAS